eukprot:SM000121S26008  [mRNA]  locus=s121:376929:378182:+ [translate_table: standard]
MWYAYDPAARSWWLLPPIPGLEHRNVLTLQFAALDGRLWVSGMVERDKPAEGANRVVVYDPCTNAWSRISSVRIGRWFCMSGIVDGRLYIAGGIGTSNNLSMVSTVETYDEVAEQWQEVKSNAPAELMTLPGYQAILNGCLYAKNIGWGPRLGVCLNPVSGAIHELSRPMVQVKSGRPLVPCLEHLIGWQGPTAALHGRLYIVDFSADHQVKFWNDDANKWQDVDGLRMPAAGLKPWAVQLVSLGGNCLCLLRPDLSLLIATIPKHQSMHTAEIPVEEVKGPAKGCRGDGAGSHAAAVLGCQVLFA